MTEAENQPKDVPAKSSMSGHSKIRSAPLLQQKFLGIPVWGWVTIAVILAWAGLVIGLVVAR